MGMVRFRNIYVNKEVKSYLLNVNSKLLSNAVFSLCTVL
jgi:hypothetical protein